MSGKKNETKKNLMWHFPCSIFIIISPCINIKTLRQGKVNDDNINRENRRRNETCLENLQTSINAVSNRAKSATVFNFSNFVGKNLHCSGTFSCSRSFSVFFSTKEWPHIICIHSFRQTDKNFGCFMWLTITHFDVVYSLFRTNRTIWYCHTVANCLKSAYSWCDLINIKDWLKMFRTGKKTF